MKRQKTSTASGSGMPSKDIFTIKNELLNTALISFAVISIPSLAASLSRLTAVGWKPILTAHVFAFILVAGTVLYRQRLSYEFRSIVLLGVLYLGGCAGLVTWGLIGMGTFWLVTLCILATIFWGGKTGWAALVLSGATIAVTGTCIHYRLIFLDFDNNRYAVASSAWITAAMGVVFFTYIMGMCVAKMHRHLFDTITVLNDKTRELENINAKLVKEISQRTAVEEVKSRLETKLVQSQKMEAIGTLAGGIAHDFNNILSGILGYSQLAALEIHKPSAALKHLENTQKNIRRATELVQQILTFSRQTEYQKCSLYIGSEIKETLKLLRSTIPATIDIRSDITSQSKVLADPIRIHQLIMNLFTNAYHAMAEKGGSITVSLTDHHLTVSGQMNKREMPPGDYVRLKVRDTGHGMTGEVLEKAFDPYFTTKQMGKGTGLGLALVRAIIEEHEGFFEVKSRPEAGTDFTIFLPVVNARQMSDGHARQPSDTDALDRLRGDEKIMIVDDEDAIRQASRLFLEKLGYRICLFENGRDAFDAFAKDPDQFDLAVTDMTMPGMTGLQLARQMLDIRPSLPIILCTGFSENISEITAGDLGITYVQKPVAYPELIAKMRSLLSPNPALTDDSG